MKYYSEKLKKLFDTVDELKDAEKEFEEKQLVKKQELEVKKTKAQEVEDAYKNYIQVTKDANQKVTEAYNQYLTLRNAFVKEYNSFHMSYRDSVDATNTSIWNSLFDFFKYL